MKVKFKGMEQLVNSIKQEFGFNTKQAQKYILSKYYLGISVEAEPDEEDVSTYDNMNELSMSGCNCEHECAVCTCHPEYARVVEESEDEDSEADI